MKQQVPRFLLVVWMYLWADYIENFVVNRTAPLYARTDVLCLTILCFYRMIWPRHLLIITVRLWYFTIVSVLLFLSVIKREREGIHTERAVVSVSVCVILNMGAFNAGRVSCKNCTTIFGHFLFFETSRILRKSQ